MDIIVTFSINDELFEQFDSFDAESFVRYLLMDALGEFKSVRSPAESYVKQRYEWKNKDEQIEKMKEVVNRTLLAGIMHSNIYAIRFIHRTDPNNPHYYG